MSVYITVRSRGVGEELAWGCVFCRSVRLKQEYMVAGMQAKVN